MLLGTGCGQAAAGRVHPVLRHESAGAAADRAHPVLRHEPAEAAGSWGRAIAVPGLAALNKGREAVVLSVSCPSTGACGLGVTTMTAAGVGSWTARATAAGGRRSRCRA